MLQDSRRADSGRRGLSHPIRIRMAKMVRQDGRRTAAPKSSFRNKIEGRADGMKLLATITAVLGPGIKGGHAVQS